MKPGIMLYFDMLPMLELLTNEEAGELLIAAINFGAGELPEITMPRVKKTWPHLKKRIEADNRAYYEKTRQAEYAVFARDHKGISRKEWEARYSPERYKTLEEVIASAGEEAPEPPPLPEKGPPEDNPFIRWINYRGFTDEQAALTRPYFDRWERERGADAVAAAVNAAIAEGRDEITFPPEEATP